MKPLPFFIATLVLFTPVIIFAAGLVPCGGPDEPECQACYLIQLGDNIINFLIMISAAVGTLLVAVAGFRMATARGNTTAVASARSMLTNIIIGFVILLAAWLIVDTIMKSLVPNNKLGRPWNEISCVALPEYGNTASIQGVSLTAPPPHSPNTIARVDDKTGEVITVSGTRLTGEAARTALATAGINIWESAPGRTSLEGINASVINETLNIRNACGCAVTVTGGTESGHASGNVSHANGYKIDLEDSTSLTSYIQTNYTRNGTRGDGAALYKSSNGCVTYARESSHWDVSVTCN